MDESKPWAGAELPCSEADRLLFNSSTKVTIGDGAKARFWHSSWLNGEAPKYLAPHLFDLVRRKNKSVQQELRNYSWVRSLRGRITSAFQVEEFVSLWIRLQNIQLTPGVRDSIVWRWTAMLLTPPIQRTGSSSKVPMADSEMTSFGEHMLRIKEKCLFGSWCGKKS